MMSNKIDFEERHFINSIIVGDCPKCHSEMPRRGPLIEMIRAADLVNHPEKADSLEGKIRTVWDSSFRHGTACKNLEKAMNILASKGWKPVTMSVSRGFLETTIFVIMEKPC